MKTRLALSVLLAGLLITEASASRLFDAANPDSIENQVTAVVSNEPFTFAAWVYPTSFATTSTIVSIGSGASSGESWRLGIDTSGQGFVDKLFTGASPSGVSRMASAMTVNTWNQLTGVFTSDTSRTVWQNASAATVDTTSVTDFTVNRTSIGIQAGNLSAPRPAAARIAEVAIWNIALSSDDINALSKGFSPQLVRPQNLVLYVPLIRNVGDLRNSLALTTTGTTVADHPRILY
jgi:hypothetical protein